MTVAPETVTASADTVNDNSSPFNAVAFIPSVKSVDKTCPDTTWYVRISTSVAFSSSVSKDARSIPAAVKAASVGANTVKGPSPDNVETRPAWANAATKESCTPVPTALVGISSVSSATTIGDITRLAVISKAIITLELNMKRLATLTPFI